MVVAHLLPGCARCSAEIASLRKTLSRQRALAKDLPTIGPSYDAAFKRALTATLNQVSSIFEDDEARLPAQAHRLVTLYKSLLRQSWSLRHKDPAAMVYLGRRATLVAHALSPSRYGARKVAHWQSRAWAELGNAHRVMGDYEAADVAFKQATELSVRGLQDDLLEARRLDLQASLSTARRQLETACAQVDVAYELCLRREDRHLAGRALIKKGIIIGYGGNLEKCMYLIRRGLAWIDKDREPELPGFAIHNLAYFLKELGQWHEARAILTRSAIRWMNTDDQFGLLRHRWLEGEVLSGLGDHDSAEQVLLEVKREFEGAGLYHKAADVSLDLGTVWRRQGRDAEANQLTAEAEAVFHSLQIRPPQRKSLFKPPSGKLVT